MCRSTVYKLTRLTGYTKRLLRVIWVNRKIFILHGWIISRESYLDVNIKNSIVVYEAKYDIHAKHWAAMAESSAPILLSYIGN